ncbi:hypothetical protein JNUCC42_14310 [Brevibacterium sp. JNUCC-42]|nr:hypothetical protein [Brevibacillus laterosporus]QOT01458.1 hypothetical protein JNUCC42_14310 [Brevibacterium sp. JNUCC-42]
MNWAIPIAKSADHKGKLSKMVMQIFRSFRIDLILHVIVTETEYRLP